MRTRTLESFEKLQFILQKVVAVNDEPFVRNGAPEARVLAMFDVFNLKPDPLLVRLYRQHDGIDGLDAFLRFLPLKDVELFHSMFLDAKQHDMNFEWEPTWIPVFDMNANAQICIDTDTGRLMAIDMENGTTTEMAAHYEKFIDPLHDIFADGKYAYDPTSGSIELDSSAWHALAARYRITGIHDIW